MKRSSGWIGLPLMLALAACAGDADDGDLPPVAQDETSAPVEQPAAAPAAGESQTLTLAPLTDAGVAGEATMTEMGDQTQVMVRLTGAPPESSHPGHIHTGSCDNIGGVVQGLQTIDVDATGAGTMTTTLDAPPMSLMDGGHIVVYHGDGGTPITCAAIPMM